MNPSYLLLGLFLLPIMQIAHAQSLTDTINNAVGNNIKNTFDSINQGSNNSGNTTSGAGNDSQTTTTTTTTHGPGNSNSTTTTMKTNSQS